METPLPAGAAKRAKMRARHEHAWSLTGGRCVYCNARTPAGLQTVDHMIPRSQGGLNTRQNLLPACCRCNNARGTTSPASGLAHPKWKSLVRSMEIHHREHHQPTPNP